MKTYTMFIILCMYTMQYTSYLQNNETETIMNIYIPLKQLEIFKNYEKKGISIFH